MMDSMLPLENPIPSIKISKVKTAHVVAKGGMEKKLSLSEIWRKSVNAEADRELMEECLQNWVCLPQVISALEPIQKSKKSLKHGEDPTTNGDAEIAIMKVKLADAKRRTEELRKQLERAKENLKTTIKKEARVNKIIRKARSKARREYDRKREKNRKKIQHLITKKRRRLCENRR